MGGFLWMVEAGRGRFGGSCPGTSKTSLVHPVGSLIWTHTRRSPLQDSVDQEGLSLLKDPE